MHTPAIDDPAARQILAERARLLALEEITTDVTLGEEMVAFLLGAGQYALPARAVREVAPLGAYTPLPMVPGWIVGLVNVRGQLLTAIDIRPLLELPQTPPPPEAFVLLVQAQGVEIALLADSVLAVERGDRTLTPTFSATAGRPIPWVRGLDHAMNIVLDPELLLEDPRLLVHDDDGEL